GGAQHLRLVVETVRERHRGATWPGIDQPVRKLVGFVENEIILQHLAEIGVDYAQGYGVARPRPVTEVNALHNLIVSCL
ncbi:MAG TPA: hypothetical protein ENJ80_03770, partial [Gammaproteobacteria bacterium]|nr:hypothetical protein [Gammaproteobacteria bacterium]